jgi:predicted RNase H-like nuclease
MYFVGIDLAWSPKNLSGVCVSEGEEKASVVCTDLLRTDSEIVEYVSSVVEERPCIIAIDAPLVVPNKKGRRIADELVTKFFREYEAGAHPTNRERLEKFGGLRGETLVTLFEEKGFSHEPYFKPRSCVRVVMEVFPHPAQVVLFGLPKTLKYKFKKGRSKELVLSEFQKYLELLKTLKNKTPSLSLPGEFLEMDIRSMKRAELKHYEDILDAVFCSYIAQYYWYWGLEKNHIFGNKESGYIVTPVFPGMKHYLEQEQQTLF